MKQKKNKDISILLYALLLFSFGIGWVYSKNTRETGNENTQVTTEVITQETKSQDAQKTPEEPKQAENKITIPTTPEPPAEIVVDTEKAAKDEELTAQEILIYSKELIRSKSINNLVALIKDKCPENIVVSTVDQIITINKEELSRYEKLKIILSVGKYYETNKQIQRQLFDLIIKNKNLETGKTPLLFAAIEIKEKEVIPALLEWYKNSGRPETKDLAMDTLEYAAKNDYGLAIKSLQENSPRKIEPEHATKLLWLNLKANKTGVHSRSIEVLKAFGADLNSQDPKTQFTPLIQAVINKNLEAVQQLVKFGASPTLGSSDKSVGFPLQFAREYKQLDIENFLRSKGARD